MSKSKQKVKYDAEYIRYVESGESAAVFITRDIVRAINTNGKWIDVLKVDGTQIEYQKLFVDEDGYYFDLDTAWNFESFDVELFPRKTKPVYPENSSIEEKKYITWKTANEDIALLRGRGYKGSKFHIVPKLVNYNKYEYDVVSAFWDKKSKCWTPFNNKTASCELRDFEIPAQPKFDYHILSIKRI